MTHPTVESIGRLADQMTTSADSLAVAIGNFDDLIEQRVGERVAAELGRVNSAHAAEVAELGRQARLDRQRLEDVRDELRRQLAVQERNYQRAAAALRASGDREYQWGKRSDVDGEPPASDPAGQIGHWLAELVPACPAGRMVLLMGDLAVTANLEGDLRGNQTDVLPDGGSRVFPIGGLAKALAVVAGAPDGETAKQLRVSVRNVMVGYGIPGLVNRDRQENASSDGRPAGH